ncbi:MAG: circadian clock protein KaiB [Anaerolinea sp.]|nr:circadian clock protein KaiB [Anaerolinea sp.]
MEVEYVFKLFIAGQTTRSMRAIESISEIIDKKFSVSCVLTVVDILERPDLAETHNILATPTLVRELPLPQRRLIGDLVNSSTVLSALGLAHDEQA